jgi:saccharopepsin
MMLPSDRLGAAAVAASLVGGVAGAVLDLPIVAFNGYNMVELDVGTPASTYRLMFDTGSASTWILDKECAENCPNVSDWDRNPGYDAQGSSTANSTGKDAVIQYLGGRVAGVTVVEDFKHGDVTWKQPFIAANETNWAAQPNHGFMGLAFGSIADGGATPIFEDLMAQGLMDEHKFGLYYNKKISDTPHDLRGKGVLTLGGSREEEFVEGDMVTIDVTTGETGYDLWRSVLHSTTSTRAGPNGTIETELDFFGGTIVFDTGASGIDVDPNNIEALYESIGMNWTAIIKDHYIPLCKDFNDSWSVSLEVGFFGSTRQVTLTGDMLVLPGFAGRDDACWPPFSPSNGPGFNLFGKQMLKNFYTVWDYGNFPGEGQYLSPTVSFGKVKTSACASRRARSL